MQLLAERAGDYDVDIRWGHALTGFDQDADGVTVQVAGPDGAYQLPARYLVGADGGTSPTRKLAGIDFPGMTSHDAVARMAFGVAPPDEWVDPVSGALDMPGWGRVPHTPFHRAEQGVFACRRLGGRAMVITLELDRSAREDRSTTRRRWRRRTAGEPAPRSRPALKRVLGADVPLRPVSPDAPLDLRRFYGINSRIASRYQSGRVILVGDAAHVHSPMGGPGLNLGLQDAVNLGWKLAAVIAVASSPRCSTPTRPSAGPPPSGSSCTAAPSWPWSGQGPRSPRCANCFPNCSRIPTIVASPQRSDVRRRKSLRCWRRRPSAGRALGARFRGGERRRRRDGWPSLPAPDGRC